MITRYPILEFLSTVTGLYKDESGSHELEFIKNGYGFLLLTKLNPGRGLSQVHGVIGVSGKNLELHANMGLPNIITFTWPYALEAVQKPTEIVFTEIDDDLIISLLFDEQFLKFGLKIGGNEKKSYILQKA